MDEKEKQRKVVLAVIHHLHVAVDDVLIDLHDLDDDAINHFLGGLYDAVEMAEKIRPD